MVKTHRVFSLFPWFALGIALIALININFAVSAQSATPTTTPGSPTVVVSTPTPSVTPTPKPRINTITEQYNGFLWWLVSYSKNEVLCGIPLDREGQPTGIDILGACGDSLYQQYRATSPCHEEIVKNKSVMVCEGVYVLLIKTFVGKRDRTITYPLPFTSLNLKDCVSEAPVYRCNHPPMLEISGAEPMDGQRIISVEGKINEVSFRCETNPCLIPLQGTGLQGARAEFWANSSFGDSSVHQTALVRVMPFKNPGGTNKSNQNDQEWIVEVASNRWVGVPSYSCAHVWESLPDPSAFPSWLNSPRDVEMIKTNSVFYYLGGALIRSGQVNVNGCPNNGLQTGLIPNLCGMLRARPKIEQWQNQFDQTIIDVAQQENIPASLIKNIFSRESQFWPGVYNNNDEVGLGQLTDGGADTLLMWNPTYFQKFCSGLFDAGECGKGYVNLYPYEQSVIRGALLGKVNALCIDCATTIDIEQAKSSVDVFAASLEANCEQTGQIIFNMTGKAAGISSSYVDLWKFTLTNYNAGSGCLQDAVEQTLTTGATLNWENISSHLAPGCQGAVKYVNDITNVQITNSNATQ